MPMQYCSGPDHPGGKTSGHRPGPFFFENSRLIPATSSGPPRNSRYVILVVSGQLPMLLGEFTIVATLRLNGAKENADAALNGPASSLAGSIARARQK